MANKQVLTYSIRLPDDAQADALRLLDVSRAVVNQTLTLLWPRLDEFAERPSPQAWKHVTDLIDSPDPHGNRQWRCEAETAGRILRAQAERQRLFLLIQPLLSANLIQPASGKIPARKDRKALMTQMRTLAQTSDATAMEMLNVAEQCCNLFLRTGRFPATYEELQPIPVLKTGQLTYAGDDGMKAGQTYRITIDLATKTAAYRMRGPDATGTWHWPDADIALPLPDPLVDLLRSGTPMAPTLREVADPGQDRYAVLDLIVEVPTTPEPTWEQVDRVLGWDWGVRSLVTTAVVTTQGEQTGRPFFLNTGGFDGTQARLRQQIDQIKKRRAAAEARLAAQPEHAHQSRWATKRDGYAVEIARCWRKYERRHRDLAHLAANVLVFLAQLHGCTLICGESLSSLRTTGRGRDAKGRWLRWRNNRTIRSEIGRLLQDKAHRWGIRCRFEQPRNTSHMCPRCHRYAHTYRSSDRTTQTLADAVDWGKWLICDNPTCACNGARDYAAALNIARLGVACLRHDQATKQYGAFSMASPSVQPCRYTPQGASLRLPTPGVSPVPSGKRNLAYQGWTQCVHLRTAQPGSVLIVLASATVRKQVLSTA